MESLGEAGELVYGPVTLNNWLSVSSQLLRNERNFGDLALSDIGTSMEVSIVNTIESLSESGVIQESLNDSGDVCVAVEDNLIQNLEGIQVENLFDFFDTINILLSDFDTTNLDVWRMSLLRKIGGRGSLRKLWEKLLSMKLVMTRKRKASSDATDNIDKQAKRQRMDIQRPPKNVDDLPAPLASSERRENVLNNRSNNQMMIGHLSNLSRAQTSRFGERLLDDTSSSDEDYYPALNPYQADLGQGPSRAVLNAEVPNNRVAGNNILNEAILVEDIPEEVDETEQNTSNEILATSRSPNNVTAESSTDSCYDYNSCQNVYKFELYDEEIKD